MSKKDKHPYKYRAYGLNILSQLPVTGFEPAPFEVADVTIHEGRVPETLEKVINKGVLYESNDHEFLLHLGGIGVYYIKNGSEIIVQRSVSTSDIDLSAFLSGISFGVLLHQRERVPLHASTVVFQDKCILIAGVSGAGKSTLAMALVKEGGSLVADDISVIDFTGEKPAVCPAFPTVKIWEDSLKHLGISTEGLEPVRKELRKFYLPVSRFKKTNTVIDHLLVLNSYNRKEIEVKSITGVDKFRLLKRHTYFFKGIPNTGLEKNHFVLATRLANNIPVALITRPNGEFNTGNIIRSILEIL
jgi:hypothetical protein